MLDKSGRKILIFGYLLMTVAIELLFFKQCVNEKSVLISYFPDGDQRVLKRFDVLLKHDKKRAFAFSKNDNMYYGFLSLSDFSSDTLVLRHEDVEYAKVPLSAISDGHGYGVKMHRYDYKCPVDSMFFMEVVPDQNIQIAGRRNNHGIGIVSFDNSSFVGEDIKRLRYDFELQPENALLVGFGLYSIPHPQMVRKVKFSMSVVDNKFDRFYNDVDDTICIEIDYDSHKQTGDKYEIYFTHPIPFCGNKSILLQFGRFDKGERILVRDQVIKSYSVEPDSVIYGMEMNRLPFFFILKTNLK